MRSATLMRPASGDTITGAVEVLEAREDKPVTKLATSVRRQDGVVVLEGTAVCYTMDLGPRRRP
jgi:acyl dehydratase